MRAVPKLGVLTIIVFSVAGFFDALYLSAKHYFGSDINCFLVSGCEEVTTSVYSVILGVPMAYLGLVYYVFILFLSVYLLNNLDKTFIFKTILIVSGLGFLFSLYLLYLQAFVILAYCIYCLMSASISTMLFLISLVINFRLKSNSAFDKEPMIN